MSNLEFYLDNNGFEYLKSSKNALGIFFPVQFDEQVITDLKGEGGKVVQRLDGIYYPSKHYGKYFELNKMLKKIYLEFADYVVFQSDYSREQCFAMLGIKDASEYSIIHNGVNKNMFFPDFSNIPGGMIKFITTGNFRNIDMIEPVVKALDILNKKVQLELHIIGPVVTESILSLFKRDYIIMHGSKKLPEVADILKKSHIFIYSHLNPPCPNSVLEAISTGLPIVGFDSGAMSELCWFSKDLLAFVSDDIFQKYEDFNTESLADKIELSIREYNYYRQLALQYYNLYSFDECGKKYIEVFDKIFNEK